MSLAYILPGGLYDPPGCGTDLYETFPTIRKLYADVAEWTQTPVERFLSWELPTEREYREVGAIRQAAIVLGLCDLLTERGAGPSVLAGLSFGGMLGACVAGAVDRQDFFHLLAHLREFPDSAYPPQGLATLHMPVEVASDEYLRKLPEGVYVAADLGVTADGSIRQHLLSGYRAAFEELVRQLPSDAVQILPNATRAHHSPLNADHRDFMEQGVAKIQFRDPVFPLCSCLEQKTITTAAEVREIFIENSVRKASVPYLAAGIEQHDAEMALVIGPARTEIWADNILVPLVHVEQPDHVVDALTAISELGVSVSA